MRWHVMCSHVMSVTCCEVMRCKGMRSHEFVMICGWLRCHVVWFEVVVWCGELEEELVIRTTKYCKYTQFYKVLQSTTPYSKILIHSTTEYYKVRHSTTKYYKVLLRTTSTTTYYSVLQSITPFDSPTHETPSTMREATGVTLGLDQILRLPRKIILMIDPSLTWNVQYNARSNRCEPPTSPNIVNDCHDWSSSHMKRHLQCAEQQASPFHLTKYCDCHAKLHSKI